ncbi:MAG: hypothetical protein U0797_08720 [Gemmataceae bacterium]
MADVDLFKVADLSKLAVFANVYEEDLRAAPAGARYRPGRHPLLRLPRRRPRPSGAPEDGGISCIGRLRRRSQIRYDRPGDGRRGQP